jgi:hypothetical protein
MHPKSPGYDWQKTLWKIVRNPTLEVVVLAAWLAIQTELDTKVQVFPVPFGHK